MKVQKVNHNKIGNSAINTLRKISQPATARQVSSRLAKEMNVGVWEIFPHVKRVLQGGAQYGYARQVKNRFYALDRTAEPCLKLLTKRRKMITSRARKTKNGKRKTATRRRIAKPKPRASLFCECSKRTCMRKPARKLLNTRKRTTHFDRKPTTHQIRKQDTKRSIKPPKKPLKRLCNCRVQNRHR